MLNCRWLGFSAKASFGSNIILEENVLLFDFLFAYGFMGGSVAEWLACWTQAQKVPDSNRSRDAVG